MPDESDLVRRARGGDEAAFHLLFERHVCPLSGQLDRWLPGLIRRKVSIADILQEVRIVAFQRLPDFEDRGEHSFRNWLYRIAQLKARKAVRRYARTSKRAAGRELSRGARMDTENFLSRGPSPSEAAIATETRDLAQQAMGKLPADYEEILRFALLEELTLREAAERMGRSREATKKLYGRALARFTKVFEGMKDERRE